MSGFERAGRTAADRAGTGTTNAAGTPGKRTLTESLNAREVTAAESLAGGGSTEGGQLEKAGGAGAAVNIPVQTGHADAAAARTALTPLIDAEVAAWRAATIARWNTLIGGTDTPGGGGRGYAAGVAVLAGHIAAIRAFKASQGW
jgi:hypothetical protein